MSPTYSIRIIAEHVSRGWVVWSALILWKGHHAGFVSCPTVGGDTILTCSPAHVPRLAALAREHCPAEYLTGDDHADAITYCEHMADAASAAKSKLA